MPSLVIDGRAVEVAAGTRVIDAAERLGIYVPRLCYHPGLGAVGACRLCAVSFLEGPVKGVQMSCMVEACDGMVVSTDAPEALAFRRQVIEWLMLNHPHDCPVCDEGGHCLLQEMTVSGGHGRRRFQGLKRTYLDQDLGPRVQHEMNRCIHCYRCRRFYQEVAGGRDFGALGSARRVWFGRFADGALESPFAGNLVDLCPTGVFTDKPSRYRGRRWDFERAPSICPECSLGCATTVSARYREIVRIEARFDSDVNGHFLCDRGRYACGDADAPDRPRRARVGGREASVEEALAAAAEVLGRFEPSEVAVLGSTRATEETQEALAGLCRAAGFRGPAFFSERAEADAVAAAVAALAPEVRVSLRQVEDADCVVIAGVDPLAEAPLLALALRQAWRRGAAVAVLHPEPVDLPLDATRATVAAAVLDEHLLALARGYATGALLPFSAALSASRRPVLVCGASARAPALPAAAGEAAALLCCEGREAGLLFVLPGANAFGAAGRGGPQVSWPEAVAGARTWLSVEADALPALGGVAPERLICLDHRLTETARVADVFLPTDHLFEAGGHFRNHEGRLREAAPVRRGGTPVSQLTGGGHPPRAFRVDVPGGEPRPAPRFLDEISRRLAGARRTAP